MIKTLRKALTLLGLLALPVLAGPTGKVTFTWTDPNPPGAVEIFKLYTTTDIVVASTNSLYVTNYLSFHDWTNTNLTEWPTNWTVFATIPGGITNYTTTILPGFHFFSLTASNFWTESDFSEVVSTPAVISSGPSRFTIQRAP